ncbi:alpha/beta hydrolase [Arthrobacter sp. NPDC090010]|uniref:alpha/beta hydrolase n=1 Tax=Arthrobacter sp. NPDC090010 TaxID=3363942 RepID=UPI00382AA516
MNDARFVISVPEVVRERRADLDFYRPSLESGPAPMVVLVHGGPIPPGKDMRDSVLFSGYAALLADHGCASVMFTHGLHSPSDYPAAAADVTLAVEQARALPGVDPERVALWFFSGGGLLAADWLSATPPWLKCLALSYPVLDADESWGVDPRFRPVQALRGPDSPPMLLTRVGRESPQFAPGVQRFADAARHQDAPLEIIDLPDGQHAFDVLDHTEASREAVMQAVRWVSRMLASA